MTNQVRRAANMRAAVAVLASLLSALTFLARAQEGEPFQGRGGGGLPSDINEQGEGLGGSNAVEKLESFVEQKGGPIPPALGQPFATLARVGTTMYVIGGMKDPINGRGAMTRVRAIDLTKPQTAMQLAFTDLPPMSGSGFGGGCAVVRNGQVYIAGAQFDTAKDSGSWHHYVPPTTPDGKPQESKWTQLQSGNAGPVPRWHAGCVAGEDGQLQLMIGGVDPNDGRQQALTNRAMAFTGPEGLQSPVDTVAIEGFAGTTVPFNSTHIMVTGGIGGTDNSANSGPQSERYVLNVETGARSDLRVLLAHRVMATSFVYTGQRKYAIHFGGNVPGSKGGNGDLLEYIDQLNTWPAPSKIGGLAGPTQAFAPTAFAYDDHIFLLGGLIRDPIGDTAQQAGDKYLRIIKIEEKSGNKLEFTFVDKWTPSPAPIRGPLGLSLYAMIGIGCGLLAVFAFVASGITFLRRRAAEKREQRDVELKARAEYQYRDEVVADVAAQQAAKQAEYERREKAMLAAAQQQQQATQAAVQRPGYAQHAHTMPQQHPQHTGYYQQQPQAQPQYGYQQPAATGAYQPYATQQPAYGYAPQQQQPGYATQQGYRPQQQTGYRTR